MIQRRGPRAQRRAGISGAAMTGLAVSALLHRPHISRHAGSEERVRIAADEQRTHGIAVDDLRVRVDGAGLLEHPLAVGMIRNHADMRPW